MIFFILLFIFLVRDDLDLDLDVMPPGLCPCHTVAGPSSPRASSSWADFYWVELSTGPSSPDTAASVRTQTRSGNQRLAPKYAHISLIDVFTINFHSIQHH